MNLDRRRIRWVCNERELTGWEEVKTQEDLYWAVTLLYEGDEWRIEQ